MHKTEFITFIRNGIIPKQSIPDGRYMVTIENHKKRTNKWNAYYWAVICEYAMKGLRDMGFSEVRTKQDAHEVMKALFLAKEITNYNTGETIYVVGSTKDLSTIESSDYTEQIYQWATEYLGIVIPSPNTESEIDK